MLRETVKHLVERKPFRAMAITVSSGEVFEIRHPEAVYFAEKFMAVALVDPGDEDSLKSSMAWIDYGHIVHCKPLRPLPPF